MFYAYVYLNLWIFLEFFAGVAFLKAVPEGTYDAVIVDSSDPIGKVLLLVALPKKSRSIVEVVCFTSQALHKSCLRSPFLRQWLRLSDQEASCVLRLKAYGFTCTLLKILWRIATRSSKALSIMLGPLSPHTQGISCHTVWCSSPKCFTLPNNPPYD